MPQSNSAVASALFFKIAIYYKHTNSAKHRQDQTSVPFAIPPIFRKHVETSNRIQSMTTKTRSSNHPSHEVHDGNQAGEHALFVELAYRMPHSPHTAANANKIFPSWQALHKVEKPVNLSQDTYLKQLKTYYENKSF